MFVCDKNTNAGEKVKAIQLDLAYTVLDICRKLKLTPFLTGGSLLGAAYISDVIPGDKDVDIGLTRQEFDLFSENAKRFLPYNIGIYSIKDNKGYAFIKVVAKGTKMINQISNETNEIFVDICPYDYCSGKKLIRCIQYYILKGFKWLLAVHFSDFKKITFPILILKFISGLLGEQAIVFLNSGLLSKRKQDDCVMNFTCGTKNDFFYVDEIRKSSLKQFGNRNFYVPFYQRYLLDNYGNNPCLDRNEEYDYIVELGDFYG